MKHVDVTLPSPTENLACDEALLDYCENQEGVELLRFWEPQDPFVVLGYANQATTEVNESECKIRSIPILRRCSGGGTVLQGRGCLNYALILRVARNVELESITGANRYIMDQLCEMFSSLLQTKIEVQGITDLAIGNKKFSGNAQRRKRACLLFHGCFLLQSDLALIESCLAFPSRIPEYRKARSHQEFLTNVPLRSIDVKKAMIESWNAHQPFSSLPVSQIDLLAREKYSQANWNARC